MKTKVMALIIGPDVQDVCGSEQLCSGVKAGIELAVHTMRALFKLDEVEGLLLFDASNTFSSLSQPAALWNCSLASLF